MALPPRKVQGGQGDRSGSRARSQLSNPLGLTNSRDRVKGHRPLAYAKRTINLLQKPAIGCSIVYIFSHSRPFPIQTQNTGYSKHTPLSIGHDRRTQYPSCPLLITRCPCHVLS